MPQFEVFLQMEAMLLGTTQMVSVPYPANPVTATDATEAISQVAEAVAESISEDTAKGTYTAWPEGTQLKKTVSGFNRQPIFTGS